VYFTNFVVHAGVKKNKKMLRRYKKELEKRNLPPIDFD